MSSFSYLFINAHVMFFVLLAFVGTAVAFLGSNYRYASLGRREGTWNDRPCKTKIAAVKDGGMDAFIAQLQACYSNSTLLSSRFT
jgi:nitrate reductase gamma subunit